MMLESSVIVNRLECCSSYCFWGLTKFMSIFSRPSLDSLSVQKNSEDFPWRDLVFWMWSTFSHTLSLRSTPVKLINIASIDVHIPSSFGVSITIVRCYRLTLRAVTKDLKNALDVPLFLPPGLTVQGLHIRW